MKKVKILLGYFLAFIEVITMLILIVLLIFKWTVQDKKYIFKVIDDKNYYELVDKEIQEEMEDYLTPSGFDKDIINDLYSKEELQEDIKMYVDNLYQGKVFNIVKDNIREKLDNNIETFLKENNIDVVNRDDIQFFEEDIVNIYVNEVFLYRMLDNYIPFLGKINKILNKGIIIIGCVTIFLWIILKFVLKFRYIWSIIMGVGIILCFLYYVIYDTIDVNNLLIITDNFSLIIKEVITYIGHLVWKISIISLIVGVIISLTLSCQGKRKSN